MSYWHWAAITTYEPVHFPRGRVWQVALLNSVPSQAGTHPLGSDSHIAPGVTLQVCPYRIDILAGKSSRKLSIKLSFISLKSKSTKKWWKAPTVSYSLTQTSIDVDCSEGALNNTKACPAGPVSLIIQFWNPAPIHAWWALQSVPLQGSTFGFAVPLGVHSNLYPEQVASRGLGLSPLSVAASDLNKAAGRPCEFTVTVTASCAWCTGCAARVCSIR